MHIQAYAGSSEARDLNCCCKSVRRTLATFELKQVIGSLLLMCQEHGRGRLGKRSQLWRSASCQPHTTRNRTRQLKPNLMTGHLPGRGYEPLKGLSKCTRVEDISRVSLSFPVLEFRARRSLNATARVVSVRRPLPLALRPAPSRSHRRRGPQRLSQP